MVEPLVYLFSEAQLASETRASLVQATAERIRHYREDGIVSFHPLDEGLVTGVATGIKFAQQADGHTLLVYITEARTSSEEKRAIEDQLRALDPRAMMVWVIIPSESMPGVWLERLNLSFPKPKQTVIIYPDNDISSTFSFNVDLFFMH
ncbi:MAG TPA: hypothetical protein VFT59_03405 [Candidatus Saccharimonadales bacterium]|nr:hypothetical protein [Candidatus Saccharimonadales bacterium]